MFTDFLDILSQILGSSKDELTYGRDDSKRSLSSGPNSSEGHGMYGRDDRTSPLSPDSNGSKGQSMYDRDHPTKPLSPDSNGLKRQDMYGRRNPSLQRAPESTSDVKRKPVVNQWHYVTSYLPSSVIRVFNFLGMTY